MQTSVHEKLKKDIATARHKTNIQKCQGILIKILLSGLFFSIVNDISGEYAPRSMAVDNSSVRPLYHDHFCLLEVLVFTNES